MPRRPKHDYPRPLPKRVAKVLADVREGQTLCRCFRPRAIGEADDVTVWWFEPSGRQVGPGTARAVVSTGMVAPRDPGLFGDADAQSWGYAQ